MCKKFFRILQSVIASLFGIQSQKNMQADFAQGKFIYYLITAVAIFILLLIGLYTIVKILT
ncbi:MAG: DUF2970 domain-containing protein [Gammaproteobacteria bacterium]|nr:DUF2970 domain-containing protein [Gammaproteobacteria bacterium]